MGGPARITGREPACSAERTASADELGGAIARAIASGKPAVINVATEIIAAPLLRRGGDRLVVFAAGLNPCADRL